MLEDIDTMDTYLTPLEIGILVKALREALGLKQSALAIDAGVTERTISRIESGEKVAASTLASVAKAFKLQEDFFTSPRKHQTEDEAQKAKEKLLSENYLVPVTRLESGDVLLSLLAQNEMSYPQFAQALSDAQKELAAAFLDSIQDWHSIVGDLSLSDRVGDAKSITQQIDELDRAGLRIYVGTKSLKVVSNFPKVDGQQRREVYEWSMVVLSIIPKGIVYENALVPKNLKPSF